MEPKTDVVVRAARLPEVLEGDTVWTIDRPKGADWTAITHFRFQLEGRTDWAEGFNVEFWTDDGAMTGSLGNGYDAIEEAIEDVQRAVGVDPSAWMECHLPHHENEQVSWARVRASTR